MADKKPVHDILSETGQEGHQRRPVAFIQHGNAEDGYTYEGVCPWCGSTICYVPGIQTKVVGGLYRILLSQQKIHWGECKANCLTPPKDFAVEVTKVPLNVEKPFVVN